MNYNNSTSGIPMNNNFNTYAQGTPAYQFPYGTNNTNMLLNNAPYNNYMGNNNIQQQQNNLQFLKCRPVSSKDEAKAFQIDLDGSLWVFTDLGSGKIYTKQINNDGTANFKTYQLIEEPIQNIYNSNDFVTKEEFNKTIQSLIAVIQTGKKEEKQQLLNFNGG